MVVSYKRLWKLLIDKNMSKCDLRKMAGFSPNTLTKLRRNEDVALPVLERICELLDADFGDIIEYVKDTTITKGTKNDDWQQERAGARGTPPRYLGDCR